MPLFPAYLNITNKPVLVVGAGNIAARKIEKLLLFSPNIQLVAIDVNDEVQKFIKDYDNISFEQRAFEFSDLEGKSLVIVAIDDIPLQKEIFDKCDSVDQLCNCVDSPDYCNFIFPALVIRGDLSIGINTAGKAPYVSSRIRKLLDGLLPMELSELVTKAYEFRQNVPDKKLATQAIKKHIDELISKIKI